MTGNTGNRRPSRGRGALFINDRKTEAKHPDMKGPFTVDGKEVEASAWWKEKDGKRYLSIDFSDPYVKPGSQPGSAASSNQGGYPNSPPPASNSGSAPDDDPLKDIFG